MNQVLRLPAVKARTGLSRTTLYRQVSCGEFPRPVSIGKRAIGWVEAEIEGWIDSRITQRPNSQGSTP
jgi:prophage regulatory protein